MKGSANGAVPVLSEQTAAVRDRLAGGYGFGCNG